MNFQVCFPVKWKTWREFLHETIQQFLTKAACRGQVHTKPKWGEQGFNCNTHTHTPSQQSKWASQDLELAFYPQHICVTTQICFAFVFKRTQNRRNMVSFEPPHTCYMSYKTRWITRNPIANRITLVSAIYGVLFARDSHGYFHSSWNFNEEKDAAFFFLDHQSKRLLGTSQRAALLMSRTTRPLDSRPCC